MLEYFDAFIVGLTATPNKQTFGFFERNLVMEYGHARAVADGVNVDYQVYRIRTEITEQGSNIEPYEFVGRRDRQNRALRWERLDDELTLPMFPYSHFKSIPTMSLRISVHRLYVRLLQMKSRVSSRSA